jgi:uncharacterized protein (TIGR04255 family)
MGAPLKNPPVYLTVAQVRFNPILKLPDFLPSIQDGMRKAGFPAYEPHKAIALQLTIQDGQPTPVPVISERFSFGNLEKTHSFMLDGGALTLQSTNYGHFEAFSSVFMMGLALVHDAVHLDFTERIGLRYLDRIFPVGGDTLAQYLVPEALGLGNRLGGNVQQTYLETIIEVGAYKLRSRVVTQVGALAFPPDMLPGDLLVNKRLASYTGLYAILDNDGFLETREGYSPNGVAQHLDAIHKVIGDAFRAIASDHARNVWDQDQ